MNKELIHLVHQLKGKSYPAGMEKLFYPYGKEAFNLLSEVVGDKSNPDFQRANSIEIMTYFSLYKLPEFLGEVFNTALKNIDDESDIVFSSSSKAVVSLLRMKKEYPNNYSFNVGDHEVYKLKIINGIDRVINADKRNYILNGIDKYFPGK